VIVVVGDEPEFQCGNHRNIERKSMLQIPLSGVPTIGVFYTGKIQGGQDRTFLFRDGLANYEELQSAL
jgi:hypothetical protein